MIEIIPNWHPVFVHFPIAFATAAVAFIATDILFKNRTWAAQRLMMGRWMLWGAAIFACVAAVFGWFAYNSVAHDEAGHLAMTIHRNWALLAAGALLLLTVWDAKMRRSSAKPSYGFLILLIAAWLLVINAAWHGGEAVFRHGLGVMSLPEAEEPGHTHEHGSGHEHSADHGHEEMPAQGINMMLEDAHVHTHPDDEAMGGGQIHDRNASAKDATETPN